MICGTPQHYKLRRRSSGIHRGHRAPPSEGPPKTATFGVYGTRRGHHGKGEVQEEASVRVTPDWHRAAHPPRHGSLYGFTELPSVRGCGLSFRPSQTGQGVERRWALVTDHRSRRCGRVGTSRSIGVSTDPPQPPYCPARPLGIGIPVELVSRQRVRRSSDRAFQDGGPRHRGASRRLPRSGSRMVHRGWSRPGGGSSAAYSAPHDAHDVFGAPTPTTCSRRSISSGGEFSYMDGVIDPPSSMHRLTIEDLAFGQGETWVIGTPPVASVVMTPKARRPCTSASSPWRRLNEAGASPDCSSIAPMPGPGSWACPGLNSRPESNSKPIMPPSPPLDFVEIKRTAHPRVHPADVDHVPACGRWGHRQAPRSTTRRLCSGSSETGDSFSPTVRPQAVSEPPASELGPERRRCHPGTSRPVHRR